MTTPRTVAILTAGLAALAGLLGCQPTQPARTDAAAAAAAPPRSGVQSAPAGPLPTLAVAAPRAAPESVADTPRCQPQPLRYSRLMRGPVFRRYTGLLDKKLITVELGWTRLDSIVGRFYGWRGGPEYSLNRSYQRHPWPVLEVLRDGDDAGTWRLTRVPGLVLTGVWTDTSHRRHAFRLREDYRGAVPYEIQVLTLSGGKPDNEYADCRVPYFRQHYLHLRDAAGRRPALRHLQPPLPVRRRRLRENYDLGAYTESNVEVRLNDFNLLSYQVLNNADPFGGRHQLSVKSWLIDLTTGQSLTIASQLRPDYELPLRRLLTTYLLRTPYDYEWKWQQDDQPVGQLADLPLHTPEPFTEEDLLLTGEGLEATYSPYSVFANPGGNPPVWISIPYRELRPLVRPGTPLARMLRARGLW